MKIIYDDENYFGHCPNKNHRNFVRNVGPDHWMCCDECKIRWLIGSDLFSGWRDEDESDWESNIHKIANYKDCSGSEFAEYNITQEDKVMGKSFSEENSESRVSKICECGAEMEELAFGIDHESFTEDWYCPACGRLIEFHPDQGKSVVLSESTSTTPDRK